MAWGLSTYVHTVFFKSHQEYALPSKSLGVISCFSTSLSRTFFSFLSFFSFSCQLNEMQPCKCCDKMCECVTARHINTIYSSPFSLQILFRYFYLTTRGFHLLTDISAPLNHYTKGVFNTAPLLITLLKKINLL